ncbi:hypothetical protein B296_00021294 [Ensete ventricosum]|uniref:Uncharacterized protein n=1 Tax=Ensete ventricosum TaxID=4639 RepID=A0A426X6I6_ENSVE|nr:hypothetical protein B296_00021294 [Ensete ventricosum]
MKLQQDNEPRSSLGIGPGLDDAVGPRREFARRFTEGIRKLAGSTPGCAQLVDQRVGQHQVQVRIRKVEGTTFTEISMVKPPVSDGCTAAAQAFGRLTHPG